MAYIVPLVSSFMKFLDERIHDESLSKNNKEILRVAMQSLKTAFSTTAEDSQLPLMDVFIRAMEKKRIQLQFEKNFENEKIEAELLKNGDYDLMAQNEMPREEAMNVIIEDSTLEDDLEIAKIEAKLQQNDGDEQMLKNCYKEAITCYTNAIALDEHNAVCYFKRAAALNAIRQFDFAIGDCKHAVRIDPKYADAYDRMGLAYAGLEQYPNAKDCHKQALELDPDNEGYKINLRVSENKISESQGIPSLRLPFELNDLLDNPAFINVASQLAADPNIQTMVTNLISRELNHAPNSGTGGGEVNLTPNEGSISQMANRFTAHMQTTNPNFLVQMRQQMNSNRNPSNQVGQNP